MGHMDNNRATVAGICGCLASVVLCAVCIGLMHTYSDRRLTLTTLHVFNDWATLKHVYENTTQYLPEFNPPSLALARFDPWGTSLGQYEDLRARGLITDAQYANVSALFGAMDLAGIAAGHPSVLYRLLAAAECTVPSALPDTTPASRSPGCQCIAATYLRFVNETVNASSLVPAEIRSKYAGEVLGCVDRRVTRRTETCSTFCTIHPIGLALYSNTVLFLSCMAFLLFSELSFGARPGTLQLVVCGVGVLSVLPFIFLGGSANWVNILGLGLVILNLVHAAREDLEDALLSGRSGAYTQLDGLAHPHPLVVCVCVNLHVIIPAFMVAVGASGFARDLYAVSSFGLAGFLLGVALQCALWDLWYNSPGVKDFKLQCFGLVCGVFLVSFLWLFSAYYDLGGAFVLSGLFGMSVFFLIILGITLSIMNMDGQKTLYVEAGQSSHHMFGASECVLGCLVLLGNLLLTIFSIVDAARD